MATARTRIPTIANFSVNGFDHCCLSSCHVRLAWRDRLGTCFCLPCCIDGVRLTFLHQQVSISIVDASTSRKSKHIYEKLSTSRVRWAPTRTPQVRPTRAKFAMPLCMPSVSTVSRGAYERATGVRVVRGSEKNRVRFWHV